MSRSLGSKIMAANSVILIEGRLEELGAFFAPDYVAHGTRHEMKGHAALRRYVGALRRAFPKVQVDVEVLVESKTRVAWQRTLRGVHHGDYKGFPASGRQVVWRDMVTSEFRNGLIAEDWVITDLAEHLLRSKKP